MGFRDLETDCRVSREDFSFCRELPSIEKSGLSDKGLEGLLKDHEKNKQAFIEIIFEYRDIFRQEDLIDAFLPYPYKETGDIDPSILAWSDRKSLETLVDIAQELFNGNEISKDIHFHAQALIASYYSYANHNLNMQLDIIEGMREAISFYHSEVRRLGNETREPETLAEVVQYGRLIKVCEIQITGSQRSLTGWISKLKLSLQASRYITSLAIS